MAQGGITANQHGRTLEKFVEDILISKNYQKLENKKFNLMSDKKEYFKYSFYIKQFCIKESIYIYGKIIC